MPHSIERLKVHPKAPSAPEPASSPPAFELTRDWRIVLSDEFDASHLDLSKWWTRYTHNDGYLDFLNDEQERYRESGNHPQSQGLLHLTAYTQNSEGFWPSGMIRSRDLIPIHNGSEWYIEALGRIPNFLGEWPAFWISSVESVAGDDSSALWPPELDMMEIVNNGAEDTTSMLHCSAKVFDWNNNPQQLWLDWYTENYNPEWGTWWAPFDFAQGYHSWSVYYARPRFIIYCDRKPIVSGYYDWVYDNGQTCPGAYILCNLAVGGSWAGRHGVAGPEAFPASFNVKHIKVWTRLPQSTIGHTLVVRED